MTAKEVCAELLRVHKEAVAYFKNVTPDLNACPPGYAPPWSYREFVRYASIHVAYHTGQIYTVRHLLGEVPPDN
jgi:hypothetical protein